MLRQLHARIVVTAHPAVTHCLIVWVVEVRFDLAACLAPGLGTEGGDSFLDFRNAHQMIVLKLSEVFQQFFLAHYHASHPAKNGVPKSHTLRITSHAHLNGSLL